jgi:transcription elongation GreA/GreB family factor
MKEHKKPFQSIEEHDAFIKSQEKAIKRAATKKSQNIQKRLIQELTREIEKAKFIDNQQKKEIAFLKLQARQQELQGQQDIKRWLE